MNYRYAESRVDVEWTLIRNGVSETKTTSIRVYGFRELTLLFSEAGFRGVRDFFVTGWRALRVRQAGILHSQENVIREMGRLRPTAWFALPALLKAQ